jgi:hypothetical protein
VSTHRRRTHGSRALSVASLLAFFLASVFFTSLGTGVARAEEPLESLSPTEQPTPSFEASYAPSGEPTEPPIECGGGDTAGWLPEGSQSISGTVRNTSGAVVPDLQVRLARSAVGFSSTTTTTNAAGAYTFDDLDDDSYVVSFFDYNGNYQSGFYDAGTLALTPDTATAVVLGGAGATGINAVLPAEQLSSIAGTVTNNSGAAVEFANLRANAAYFPLGSCDQTNSNGEYLLADVRLGAYRVHVYRPGYPGGYYRADVPSGFTTHFSEATLLTVDVDLSEIDIAFPELFSLTGEVREADGDPVEGFQVNACETVPGACSYATSDSAGDFTIEGLPAGDYHVRTYDTNQLYRSGWYAGDGSLSVTQAGAASVTVPGDPIVVLADPAPTISGTILNEDDEPLESVLVNLCEPESGTCAIGTTNEFGYYEAPILEPGTYTAQIWDNTSAYPGGGYIQPDGSIALDAENAQPIPAGATSVENVDGVLPYGGRITATLTSGGAPLAGGYVSFCQSEFACSDSAGTDEWGTATSPVLFVGTVRVQEGNGYWLVDGGTASMSFGAATPLDVTANGLATITSEVPNPDAGTPTDAGGEDEETTVPLDDGSGNTTATLTFEDVTVSGTSSLTVSESGDPVPSGFQLGLPATYYDISTTAEFEGAITVCISYAGISYSDESGLRFYHYDTTVGEWEDITVPPVDTENDRICGSTDSLSPFVIVEPTYAFGGFVGASSPPELNQAKAGSSIGVQFSLGGDLGLSIFGDTPPAVRQLDCVAGEPASTAQAAVGTLKYNARKGLYTFNWKTVKTWKNTCRELTLTFGDGSTASVWYRLRP